MTTAQKLAIRLSEIRSKLNELSGYLRLWQALRDTGEFSTSNPVKSHLATLRSQQRWKDLTDHRNAIAHWETARVDYEKVADLHRFAVEVLDYVAGVVQVVRVPQEAVLVQPPVVGSG